MCVSEREREREYVRFQRDGGEGELKGLKSQKKMVLTLN